MSATNPSNPLELLPALRKELGTLAEGVSDSNLLKFLYWKPNVQRAAGRFRDHIQWRKENPWAMDEPNKPLEASKDPELKRVLESEVMVLPDGMIDKKGNKVLVGRLRNNDMTDGRTPQDVVRMAIYTMDRALEQDSTRIHGVTIFHDLTGLSRKNMDVRIPKMLLRALVGHFPVRIKNIFILNAPLFFRGIFGIISMIMPQKLRDRTHFVKNISEIYEVIEVDQLLPEHGGKSQHDQVAWVEKNKAREEDGSIESLKDICIKMGS